MQGHNLQRVENAVSRPMKWGSPQQHRVPSQHTTVRHPSSRSHSSRPKPGNTTQLPPTTMLQYCTITHWYIAKLYKSPLFCYMNICAYRNCLNSSLLTYMQYTYYNTTPRTVCIISLRLGNPALGPNYKMTIQLGSNELWVLCSQCR